MKTILHQFIFAGILSFALLARAQQTYYVSPDGDNNADGLTESTAWETIAYALSQMEANQGQTLRLSAGTFFENQRLFVPSGVTILGKGPGNTKIRVNYFYDVESNQTELREGDNGPEPHYFPAPDEFVMQLPDDGSSRLIGFELDGQDKRCHGGIRGLVLRNSEFRNLRITNFNFMGVWIHSARNVTIKDSFFKNNAYGNNTRCMGSITLNDVDGIEISNNTIIQDDEVSKAYGISVLDQRYRGFFNFVGRVDEPRLEIGRSARLKDIRIFDNVIRVTEDHAQAGGTGPCMAINFNGIVAKNNLIYDNEFVGTVSFVLTKSNKDQLNQIYVDNLGEGDWTYKVYRNYWKLGDQGRYGIETTVPELEVYDNYFEGGMNIFSQFSRDFEFDRWKNHYFHNNVFIDPVHHPNLQEFFQINSFPKNWRFENNTLIYTKSEFEGELLIFRGRGGLNGEMTFKNNIVINATGTTQKFSDGAFIWGNAATKDNFDVSNNLFYNIPSVGTNEVEVDPSVAVNSILRLSGAKPVAGNFDQPFYKLSENSPAIDKGVVIAGVAFKGTAPDIGAYESEGSISNEPLILEEGIYKLIARHSGKAMALDTDTQGGTINPNANGTNVFQLSDSDAQNRLWRIRHLRDGNHEIKSVFSDKVLDVDRRSTANGANIQQWGTTASGQPHRQFSFQTVEGSTDYFVIIARHSGKAINVAQQSKADGANVQQFGDANKPARNRQWRFVRVDAPTNLLSSSSLVVEEEIVLEEAKIFPNPSKGVLKVSGLSESGGSITVYDLHGKLLKKKSYSADVLVDLDLTDLKSGMYLLSIAPTLGPTSTKKVIIE